MLEQKERDSEADDSKEDEFDEHGNKIRKKKKGAQHRDKNGKSMSVSDDDSSKGRDEDRPASFFTRKRTEDTESRNTAVDQSRTEQLLDARSPESEEADSGPEGLTEAEIKSATQAILDGLTRELRREYNESVESSVEELEAVVVASFVDSVQDRIEDGEEDVTEELLNEALEEALEDLLIVDVDPDSIHELEPQLNPTGPQVAVDPNPGVNPIVSSQPIGPATQMGGPGGHGPHGGGGDPNPSQDPASAPIGALLSANKGLRDELAGRKNKRGLGLLVGGVVGYIVGSRHGRKRAEEKLQPEVQKLEDQVTQLYDALESREHMIRHVVQELAARQLTGSQTDALSAISARPMEQSSTVNRESSKRVDTPSIIIPATFAALLVSKRLSVDTSTERHTWGKDFLVGGVSGYMIGRRRGRKHAETQIRTEMEQLEDQIGSLKSDVVSKDTMVHAMIQVHRETGSALNDLNDDLQHPDRSHASKVTKGHQIEGLQPDSQEKQLVDASIDRIALSRKNCELDKHRKHLAESGKASAVGEFNLASSIFLERRLMDNTENSSSRKSIERMDENELLVMSQDMYVDGESAIELYDKGRIEIEVLRTSVAQFWRKTGDYEQTLRKNLTRDESVVNEIRTDLEKAYRSILESV